MCLVASQAEQGRHGMSIVGSVLEIETYEGLEDGRMLIVSKGAEVPHHAAACGYNSRGLFSPGQPVSLPSLPRKLVQVQ